MNAFKLLLLGALFIVSCNKDDSPVSPKPPPEANEEAVIDEKNLPVNAQDQLDKPTVLIVAIPGYRHDFNLKFKAKNLTAMATKGVRAASLRPCYPSQITPNQFSLVTGLLPQNHGLVADRFWDVATLTKFEYDKPESRKSPSWYKAKPMWVIAEELGMRTAAISWIGSEAQIEGLQPSYLIHNERELNLAKKVQYLKKWISLPTINRPRLIFANFEEINLAAKSFGLNSAELKTAVSEVDSVIGELRSIAESSDPKVNLVVVSEAGMKGTDVNKVVNLPNMADLSNFKAANQGPLTMLYSSDKVLIARTLKLLKTDSRFTALRKDKVPAYLQYSKSEKIGDIVIISTAPYYLYTGQDLSAGLPLKTLIEQGWDPRDLDMHGVFIAEGPQFKSGLVLPTINNIDVFPMILKVLGLQTLVQGDGSSVITELAIQN